MTLLVSKSMVLMIGKKLAHEISAFKNLMAGIVNLNTFKDRYNARNATSTSVVMLVTAAPLCL
jgi:hypothetical protein